MTEQKAPSARWGARFLALAEEVASWSKDPSTKVGAVAIGTGRVVLETGYNGLPRGVEDTHERMKRPDKYLWTAHAEENLVAQAARTRLLGAAVYVTHLCCSGCARMLINAGVARVVCGPGRTSMPEEQFAVARQMFAEAGVELSWHGANDDCQSEAKKEKQMDTFTQPKITGYRQLTQEDAALMNEGKALAEQVGAFVEKLRADENVDQRWLSIGATDLQKGFMAVIRCIARPTTF